MSQLSNKKAVLDILVQNSQKEDSFDGSLNPVQAWNMISQYNGENGAKEVFLVDVRTNEERVFTGYVPDSVHVAWATGTAFTRNPRFVREVEAKTGKDNILILVCRSGNRSRLAATALKTAGFEHVYQVSEGFEGDLNEAQQRNSTGGWKYHRLPWIQN
jgi:rhodanese-related sulfurtransferase